MGWILRNERNLQRIELLTEVLSGKRTVASAAIVLTVTARQVSRPLIRFLEDVGGGLIHKGRDRSENHCLNAGVREYALELVRTKYADFSPTRAIKGLVDKHGMKVGREALQTWVVEDGLGFLRKQREGLQLLRSTWKELGQPRLPGHKLRCSSKVHGDA